jgi:L-iditol 2-dehydrogenase
MRVAMYYRNSDVRLEEMPTPEIGADEVLVKAMACGICGSDVMEWYRIKRAPLVLGHEMAGAIARVGADVQVWSPGDRVFASHHLPCNTCHECLTGHHTACETLHTTNYSPGGFAEYVRLPALNVDRGLFRLPDDMDFDTATFIEPVACVLRGLRAVGAPPGSAYLVLGSGISGCLNVAAARHFAAGSVFATDVKAPRRDLACEFGATKAFDPSDDLLTRLRAANGGRLADCVVVCTGAAQAAAQALACVAPGGTVLYFAVPTEDIAVPINNFWRHDITIKTTYGNSPGDAAQAIAFIQASYIPVERMITHRLPLAQTQTGFELVAAGQDSLKVIIHPQE